MVAAIGKNRVHADLSRDAVVVVPHVLAGGVVGDHQLRAELTDEPHQFAADEIDFVTVVAGQAAIAIENARLMSETLEAKRALETRKVVERAKGIMQHKLGITEEDAYLKLRNESRRLRRPMRDLADAVILSDELEKQRKPTA